MDREVARTLAELERKLHDLERTLTSLGSQEHGSAPPPAPDPHRAAFVQPPPARDNPYGSAPPPREPGSAPSPHEPSSAPPPREPGSTPPPREPGSTRRGARSAYRAPDYGAPDPAARVVDEGSKPRARAADPSTRPDAIELSELDRFRQRLTRTFDDLVEEYSRIIALRRTSPRPPDPRAGERRSH